MLEFVRRERVRAAHSASHPGPSPVVLAAAPVPTHRRVEAKRQAIDQLARRWAQLRRAIDPTYSWPKAQARVNRAIGVKRRVDASETDLDAGLDFLRTELRKLSRMYPDEAERLRIPASLEAIDNRLAAATEGARIAQPGRPFGTQPKDR